MRKFLPCIVILLSGLARHCPAFSQNPTQYLHVLSTGQSLALGLTAAPTLSTTQPYNNKSLSSDVIGFTAPLIPLVERTNLESPSCGIANSLHVLDSSARPVVIGLHASSGAPYLDLKKGSPPYTRAMAQVNVTKSEVEAIGNTQYVPVGVTVVHGEADHFAGNAPLYQGFLEEWQQDYETDISFIMGIPIEFPMFVSQMNTGWTGELAVAQYRAHKDNPSKIILIGPKYYYNYSDELHLTNVESKHLGEMFAKVIHEVALKGNAWSPLMPTSIVRSANVITVYYNIPVGNLVIDTVIAAERPHYGFEFVQTGGNNVTITDVALVNGSTAVQVILSTTPTGTDQLLRYAYTCYHGGSGHGMCGDGADGTAVGGNIRDTDGRISAAIGSTGLPLYNWGVTFEEEVVDQASSTGSPSAPALDLFPNPVDTRLQVSLRESSRIILSSVLCDVTGKEVKAWDRQASGSTVLLDVEEIPAGLYLLTLQIDGGYEVCRKVVVH